MGFICTRKEMKKNQISSLSSETHILHFSKVNASLIGDIQKVVLVQTGFDLNHW